MTLRANWLSVQILWTLAVLVLIYQEMKDPGEGQPDSEGMSPWAGLALGGYFFLETSLLGMPNATARWSETPYLVHAVVLLALPFLFFLPSIQKQLRQRLWDHPIGPLAIGALFLGGLLAGYFLTGPFAEIGLFLARGSSLVLLAGLLWGERASRWNAGASLGFGMVGFLVLHFLNAFSFTYPYTLPSLRGLGWIFYLAASITLVLGNLVERSYIPASAAQRTEARRVVILGLTAVLISVAAGWPDRAEDFPARDQIKAATWNIHYGYDDQWHLTLEDQAAAIAEADLDLLFLQEVDTGRITFYAIDDAYYLARWLGMNHAYLPTVERLTGIAVLYRGSQAGIEQQLLTSLQEQTGILKVGLDHPWPDVSAFGIWMGLSNEDTGRQIREALGFIQEDTPAIFGGDFNAELDSPVAEAIQAAGFIDPCQILGAIPDPDRIDFVWVRGMLPARCWYSPSQASDHPMVIVEVERLGTGP